jgi:hypothetical protein
MYIKKKPHTIAEISFPTCLQKDGELFLEPEVASKITQCDILTAVVMSDIKPD